MSIKFINKGGGKSKLPNGTSFQYSTFTNIDLNKFDTSELTSMQGIFTGCISLTSMDLSRIDFNNITTLNSMFLNCTSLASVNLSNVELENVNLASLFNGCSSLTTINFDGSNIIASAIASMFKGCASLVSIDLSNINDVSNVASIRDLFSGCTLLENFDISHWNLANINSSYTYFQNMVQDCPNLSDSTLNSILRALTTMTKTSSAYKRLSRLGLTQEQATICTTLSNWAELEALGWTTGY